MNITYLLDFIPFPEHRDGQTIIYYNLISAMSRKHNVNLYVVLDEKAAIESNQMDYASELPYIQNFKVLTVHKNSQLARLQKKLTFNPENALHKVQLKKIAKELSLYEQDIIHTSRTSFLKLSSVINKPVVIGLTDSLSSSIDRNSFPSKLKWIYYRAIEKKMSLFKKNIYHLVTEKEADNYYSAKKLVAPNGVKLKPCASKNLRSGFCFHGVLDYKENLDAICLMSEVLKPIENSKLHIIGRASDTKLVLGRIKSLPNVKHIGPVENITEELQNYEYYLCVFKRNVGIKNKLLEAMASGCLVICSKNLVTGFPDMQHLRKAVIFYEDLGEINSVTKLTSEEKKVFRANAVDYVTKYFSWESHADKFEILYKSISPSAESK